MAIPFRAEHSMLKISQWDSSALKTEHASSWASNIEEEKRFVELRGTKAGFTWYDNGRVKIFGEEDGVVFDFEPKLGEMGNGHDRALRHFAEIILDGKEPDYVPQQGLDMIKILDGIYESARTGKEVRL